MGWALIISGVSTKFEKGFAPHPGFLPSLPPFLVSFPTLPAVLTCHQMRKLPLCKAQVWTGTGLFHSCWYLFSCPAFTFILLLDCREHGFCSAYFPYILSSTMIWEFPRNLWPLCKPEEPPELHLSRCRQPALLSLAGCSTTSFSPGFCPAVIFCAGGGTALYTNFALLIQESLPVWWVVIEGRPCLCALPVLLFSEVLDTRRCWRQDAQCGWSKPLHLCLGNQGHLWLMVLWARWLAGLLNSFLGVSLHKSNKMVLPSYSWHMCLKIWSFAF